MVGTDARATADRLYSAYWQDGSLDTFAGLGLAGIGLGWIFDQVAVTAALPAILVPFWALFRRRFVEPRLGHVRFDQERRARVRRGHLALLGAGTVALLLVAALLLASRPSTGISGWARAAVPALPAALAGLAGLLAGWWLQLGRLAAYGLLSAALGAVGAVLGAEPGWPMLIGGLIVTASGMALLVRFFRAFPPLPREME